MSKIGYEMRGTSANGLIPHTIHVKPAEDGKAWCCFDGDIDVVLISEDKLAEGVDIHTLQSFDSFKSITAIYTKEELIASI